MTWKRSFLVVANVTATSGELIDALKARAPASFTLVIPATPFGGGREAAVAKLGEALEDLRAAGLEAQGTVGNADRRLGPEALRRDHRLDPPHALLEVASRGVARADRQADRCPGHSRGLPAAQARPRGGPAAGAPGQRHGAVVGTGLGRSQAAIVGPRRPVPLR